MEVYERVVRNRNRNKWLPEGSYHYTIQFNLINNFLKIKTQGLENYSINEKILINAFLL
jgi:hypothetical protein